MTDMQLLPITWHRWADREGNRGLRAFIHVYNKDRTWTLAEGRFEGYVFSGAQHNNIALRVDEESAGLQFSVGLAHVANVWLTVGSPRLSSWLYHRFGRSLVGDRDFLELGYHDRALWWSVWADRWSWSRDTPRWRKGSFHWWDWLAGRALYHREDVEGPVRVALPLPEGKYEVDITLQKETWKRPRWPWPQVRDGFDMKPVPQADGRPGYLPIPGKGENSWDIGPDGIFGMHGTARSIEEAMGQVITSVLRDRVRRGRRHDYHEAIS